MSKLQYFSETEWQQSPARAKLHVLISDVDSQGTFEHDMSDIERIQSDQEQVTGSRRTDFLQVLQADDDWQPSGKKKSPMKKRETPGRKRETPGRKRERTVSAQLDVADIPKFHPESSNFSDHKIEELAIGQGLESGVESGHYHRIKGVRPTQNKDEDMQLFTLNDAYEHVGGFGRFQVIALILLGMLRELGQFHIQAFALLVMPPESYHCTYNLQTDGQTIDRQCTVEEVCQLRQQVGAKMIQDLHYQPNTESTYYLNNWFIQMDATCATNEELNFICSSFFLGFMFGVLLFPLPDMIGRKKTMMLVMILYLAVFYAVNYGTTIWIKTVAMFLQGFFHIKITLSYTHMYELVREGDKPFCAQIINMADTIAMALTGSVFLFVTRDAVGYLQVTFVIFTVGTLLYFYFIPESPRWLLTNGRVDEGIAVLNFIAKVNGVQARMPTTAQFDILGQIIEQSEALDNVSVGVLRVYETSSLLNLAHQIHIENTEKGTIIASSQYARRKPKQSSRVASITGSEQRDEDFTQLTSESEDDDVEESADNGIPGITNIIYRLFCDPQAAPLFFKSMIMLTVSLNCIFLSLYQSRFLEGNKFVICIIIGIGSTLGNIFSAILLKWFQDYKIYCTCLALIIASQIFQTQIKHLGSDIELQAMIAQTLFFFQLVAVGANMNLQFIILGTRMDPQFISAGLEICFCIASLIASTSPVLASQEEPIPLMAYLVYCILGLSVVSTFSTDTKKSINIAQSIASLVDGSDARTTSVLPYDNYVSQGDPLITFKSNMLSSEYSWRKSMHRKGDGALSIRSYVKEQPNYVTDYEFTGNKTHKIKRIDNQIKFNGYKKGRKPKINQNRIRLDLVLAASWNINDRGGEFEIESQDESESQNTDRSSSFQQSNMDSYEQSLL